MIRTQFRPLALLLVAACAAETGRAGPIVTDSAGVRIVDYATWAPDTLGWRIGAEPVVQIGMLEGEDAYQFDRISGVTRLGDGRIVVANGGTNELRVFDATGRHLQSAGRQGGGPGEFEGMGELVRLPGDSVAVYDWNLARVSFFAPDGAFVRSFQLQYAEGAASLVGRFTSGSWLSRPGFVFGVGEAGTDVVRDTSVLLVFDGEGQLADTAAPYVGPDFYVRSNGGSAFASSLPFGRATETVVWGDRFYAAYTDRFEIVRRDAAGTADLIVRASRPTVSLTDAVVEAHKAERLAEADERWRARLEELYRDIPFPPTLPAFGDLQVDADGNLWVLDVPLPGDETRHWTVFTPDGELLGAIETPPGVAVREIGRDYLLGTWSDELDVQYVRLYRLERVSGE